MKKKIIFGIFALALIAINLTRSFQNEPEGFSFGQLLNVAFADGEGGDPENCYTDPVLGGQLFDCGNGYQYGERWGILTCAGYGSGDCLSGTYYYVYSCDGSMVGSDDVIASKCE